MSPAKRTQLVVDELGAMDGVCIPFKLAARAAAYVRAHPEEFAESTAMSLREAADMAVDCARYRQEGRS